MNQPLAIKAAAYEDIHAASRALIEMCAAVMRQKAPEGSEYLGQIDIHGPSIAIQSVLMEGLRDLADDEARGETAFCIVAQTLVWVTRTMSTDSAIAFMVDVMGAALEARELTPTQAHTKEEEPA